MTTRRDEDLGGCGCLILAVALFAIIMILAGSGPGGWWVPFYGVHCIEREAGSFWTVCGRWDTGYLFADLEGATANRELAKCRRCVELVKAGQIREGTRGEGRPGRATV